MSPEGMSADGTSPEDQPDWEEMLDRIERGGIPASTEERLGKLGEGTGTFNSDLSVADFALCHRLGVSTIAQVMGSSIYQVGYQATPWPMGGGGGFMFEMEALSEAWNEARERALRRLAHEARLVQADAVVGVRLNIGQRDWAEESIEYSVIGTAVREHADRREAQAPVLTELSVADYAKLRQAGIEPLGIVAWSSVFFVAASYATQALRSFAVAENREIGEYTQGIYSARESTIERMTQQAREIGASGVIGVRIGHRTRQTTVGSGQYSRGGLMVSFNAIGTAIREDGSETLYAPEMTIDLTSTPDIETFVRGAP